MGSFGDVAAPHTCAAPDLLTPREAMAVLRIGRTTLYAEARRFGESDGAVGIPNVEVGGQRRFPRVALETMIGCPITWPPFDVDSAATAQPTDTTTRRAPSQRARRSSDSPRLRRV